MRVLLIAKMFGKIAPGRAGAELPDDRLYVQPVALVAVVPDMAGAAWKQMFDSCELIVAQSWRLGGGLHQEVSHESRFARSPHARRARGGRGRQAAASLRTTAR
jgi:hypothetical protein